MLVESIPTIFDVCQTNVCCYSKPEHLQQCTATQSVMVTIWYGFNMLPHPNQWVTCHLGVLNLYICAMQHVVHNLVQGYFLTAFGVSHERFRSGRSLNVLVNCYISSSLFVHFLLVLSVGSSVQAFLSPPWMPVREVVGPRFIRPRL
jgi:hypothetical protein